MADLEHPQRAAPQHVDQLLEMVIEKLGCFELVATEEDVAAEGEATPPAGGLGVMDQDLAWVVGVCTCCVVVDATWSRESLTDSTNLSRAH